VRRRRAAVLLVLVAAAGGGTWVALHRPPAIIASCTAEAGGFSFTVDPEQAANATTIAAEAQRQGLPDHAVSVGLAAALQESKLRNLDYGDRDSLGLFQQRPSQGWGTPAQLQDPRYAAAAFYRGLRKVRGWQDLPIYQAAQRVQRSADASAYATWDTASRTLARGITGETPGGVACRFPGVPRSTGATPARLHAAVSTGVGPDALSTGLTPSRGWLVASWLMTRAPRYSIDRIGYQDWTWTPTKGWRRTGQPAQAVVSYSLRPPKS
jgi:hypothetical protein